MTDNALQLIICAIFLYFALTAALHRRLAPLSEKAARAVALLQFAASIALAVYGVMTALDIMLLFAFIAADAALLIFAEGGKSVPGTAENAKKHKKSALRVLSAICAAAVLLLPMALLAVGAFVYPSQYAESYLGELPHKVRRLDDAGEGKVVIVGGSSVAFGLDSARLSEILERPTVNFGLYATLGTEVMIELAARSLCAGDIVVIAPETDSQTLSDYFGAEAVLQAFDGNAGMLSRLPSRYIARLGGAFYRYSAGKLAAGWGYSHPASGIYGAASFNEYGDVAAPRAENIMAGGVDGTRTIKLSPDMASEEFIGYLNSFAEYAKKVGAEVYFSFPPMNRAAVVPTADAAGGTDEEKIAADAADYYAFFAERLNFPVITDPFACIMGCGYFYDTNYHLNDSGVTVNTARLAADILRAMGSTRAVTIELPPEPALPERTSGGGSEEDDRDADMFTYSDYGAGLMISGTTDAAKSRETLTVPRLYEGRVVIAIGSGAFSGCSALSQIVINDNISQIMDGAFAGCGSLRRVRLEFENADVVTVGEALLEGAPSGLYLYVSESAFPSFTGNYNWYEYSDRIKREK